MEWKKEEVATVYLMFGWLRPVGWRDWDEWRETSKMLYSFNPREIECGCARVSAWSAKQNIPVAIEVTAALQHELHSSTPNTLALSLAVVRFINGVVEPLKDRNRQVPISTIGSSYGIPDFVVDIRHSATHGQLPSFEFAAIAGARALDWLRVHYWEAQSAELDDIESSLRDDLLQVLLESKQPFRDFRDSIVLSFGVAALRKLVLNPAQSAGHVSPAFREKVAQLLNQVCRRFPEFGPAFALEIAHEAALGAPLAADWIRFLGERGLAPARAVVTLSRWAGEPDPFDVDAVIEPGRWPPTPIGSLPVDAGHCLTMTQDEFEFVDPLEEQNESDVPEKHPAVPDVRHDPPERERENLIEIW
jgi:ribosomal biogenesis protein LAS1